tara:strand:+ start:526 stop:795 length:270 start_codon:yes stop_codon:yes gene_type:complete
MSSNNTTAWSANDYSNIITISSAAIASVLLVVFKSRCKKINICCGLLSCDRVIQSDSEGEDDEDKKKLTKTKSKSNANATPEPELQDLY